MARHLDSGHAEWLALALATGTQTTPIQGTSSHFRAQTGHNKNVPGWHQHRNQAGTTSETGDGGWLLGSEMAMIKKLCG